jgi:hypothetical protein
MDRRADEPRLRTPVRSRGCSISARASRWASDVRENPWKRARLTRTTASPGRCARTRSTVRRSVGAMRLVVGRSAGLSPSPRPGGWLGHAVARQRGVGSAICVVRLRRIRQHNLIDFRPPSERIASLWEPKRQMQANHAHKPTAPDISSSRHVSVRESVRRKWSLPISVALIARPDTWPQSGRFAPREPGRFAAARAFRRGVP